MIYKGVEIEKFGSGWTIFYEGDEIYFETIKKAKEFVDEMKGMKNERTSKN